jgi:membrane-bound lytic murein transglycosylase D
VKTRVTRLFGLALPLFILALLGGCSSTPEQRTETTTNYGRVPSSETFPVPPEIQANVDFWRNVYAKWGRGQVAIHDDEHLDVVYEVINLPGTNPDGYTTDQQALIRSSVASWKGRLRNVQDKTARGETLSAGEAALRDRLVASGGPRAIYGADERVRTQRGLRERFRRGVEVSGRYEGRFREAFRSAGLPEDLVFLPHVESSYQLSARSTAGATGVWQFMPATGRSYMHVGDVVDERLDPVVSAKAAARYLGEAHSRLGTWPLAITSYNHGVGGMARARSEHGTDFGHIVRHYQGPAFKFASRNYYAEFLAAREIATHPDKYYPGIVLQPPMTEQRIVLQQSMPATQLASQYGVSMDRLAAVNLAWLSSARSGRANLPVGHTVWLPAGASRGVTGQSAGDSVARIGAFETPVQSRGPKSLVVVEGGDRGETLARTQPRVSEVPSAAFKPVAPASTPVTLAKAKTDKPIPAATPRREETTAKAELAENDKVGKAGAFTEEEEAVLAKLDRAGKAPAKEDEAVLAKNEKTGKAGGKDDKATLVKNDKTGKAGASAEEEKTALAKLDKAGKAPPKEDKAVLAKNDKTGKAGTKDDKATPAKDDKTGKPGAKGDKAGLAKNDKTGKVGAKDDKAGLAKGDKSAAKDDKPTLAKNDKTGKAGAKDHKTGKAEKAAPKASREHVVQANETLFRVAARYELSVDQLRRMNGMTGKDNSIRRGQRLRVSI